MAKRKSTKDDDYVPTDEFSSQRERAPRKQQKKSGRLNYDILDKHASKIYYLDNQGASGTEIAQTICTELGLPQGSIKGKQINDWMSYRKKAGTGKPRPVSQARNNIRASSDDDCM
jgi:hypothetical protein